MSNMSIHKKLEVVINENVVKLYIRSKEYDCGLLFDSILNRSHQFVISLKRW